MDFLRLIRNVTGLVGTLLFLLLVCVLDSPDEGTKTIFFLFGTSVVLLGISLGITYLYEIGGKDDFS